MVGRPKRAKLSSGVYSGDGESAANNVDRWLAQGSGIRFAETRAYVDRVEDLKDIYRDVWRSELR